MRVEIEMVPDVDEEALKMNKDAMMPQAKEFTFKLGEITTSLNESEAVIDRVKLIISAESDQAVRQAYD